MRVAQGNPSLRPVGGRWYLLLVAFAGWACAAQDDPLPVRLTVAGFDGAPVAGVEISIAPRARALDDDARRWGRTDEDGRIEWALPLEAGEDRLLVQITPGVQPGIDWEESVSRSGVFEQAVDRYAIRLSYTLETPPGAVPVERTIVLEEGIAISGRAVETTGERAYCLYHTYPDMVYFPRMTDFETGTFAVNGMPRGQRIDFFFGFGGEESGHSYRWWHTLDPSQTMQDIDVGDITSPQVPPPDATLRVRLVANGYAWESEEPFVTIRRGVAIIPEGVTNHLFSYPAWDDSQPEYAVYGAPVEGQSMTRDLPIPAGTYYLAPDGLGNLLDPLIRGAYELVKSGAAAQVPGWPKVTIQAGQTLEIDFDPAAAANAIRSAMP